MSRFLMTLALVGVSAMAKRVERAPIGFIR
jgi:hypothetical protein